MYKILALALATAASAALLAEPVLGQNIVVTPDSTQQEYVEKVSRDLGRQLSVAARLGDAPNGEGISIVRFTRDADGDAANVKLYRASGKRGFDRIAMKAVSRLRTLDSAPSSIGHDQQYQANIIFAENGWDVARLEEQLAKEESARMASRPSERTVLAFGSAATRPTS
jgi:TonB family protein